MSVQALLSGGRYAGSPHGLTADQEATLARIRDEWADICLGVGPTNRQVAEEGTRLAYRAAGLVPPERVLWLGSPLHAACSPPAW